MARGRWPGGGAAPYSTPVPRCDGAIFLPTCDAAQLAESFGPVESFLMEGRGGRVLETFARDAGTLRHTRVPLS